LTASNALVPVWPLRSKTPHGLWFILLHELKPVAKLLRIGFYGFVGSKIDDLRGPILGGKRSSSLPS
jgi:hypothetical protein